MAACVADAAVRTWSASGGGRYSEPKNWMGNRVPQDGDSLVFPAKSGRCVFQNDIAGLEVSGIELSGGARQIHRGNGMTVKGDIRIDCAGGAELVVPLVWTGDGVIAAAGTNSSLRGRISGSGTIRVRTGAFLFAGDNRGFAGEIRVERGCARFATPDGARPGNRQRVSTGGKNTRIVVDARCDPDACVLLDPHWASSRWRHEVQTHLAAFHLIRGGNAASVPWLETGAGAPLALWGKISCEGKGSSRILARRHLALAGGVECKDEDFIFTMSPEACAASNTVVFSGVKNGFVRWLRAESANVLLAATIGAENKVSVEGGFLRARIFPCGPGGVFHEGERPAFLRTCLQAAPDGTSYELTDWNGKTLSRGVWLNGTRFELEELPKGYYWLKLANGNCVSFAIVTRLKDRVRNPESWYAAGGFITLRPGYDSPWYGEDVRRYQLELAARAGVSWTRSWLWMSSAVKPDGTFDAAQPLEDIRAARRSGIDSCLCVQLHSPLARDGGNLAEIYRTLKLTGETFGADVKEYEYLNEWEGRGKSPWFLAAMLKAASLGLQAGCPDAVISPPSSHNMGKVNNFECMLLENDTGKYTDYMNFHFYFPISHIPTALARHRQNASQFGMGGRACIVTEAGTNVEGGGRGRFEGIWSSFRAHDREQELATAEYILKMFALNRMQGVRRTFAFTAIPCNERDGTKDWSWAMRRDGMVRPGYAAFSTMIEKLDSASLEGEMVVPRDHLDVRAYVYRRRDGSLTVQFWSLTEIDTTLSGHGVYRGPTQEKRPFRLRVPAGKYWLSDMCGRTVEVETGEDGLLALTSTRFPQYLEGVSRIDRLYPPLGPVVLFPPLNPGRIERVPLASDEDPTIVIHPVADRRDFSFRKGSDGSLTLTNAIGRIAFECWNLSGASKVGSLRALSGKIRSLSEKKLTLPPMGCAVVEGMVYRDDFGADGRTLIRIDGIFDGRRSTKAAIALDL